MTTDIPLSEVMTPHPRSVQIEQKLSDVRAALADYRVHHLPVVDGKRLVGIISMTDMLEFGFKPRDTHEDLDEYLNEVFSIPQ
ncbi:MAG: CBS domain-containing protein, partial [Gammaproteobacteria bacterium]|nr:CBS domain-containing protein [Gammaproteobacteria bacterium]